MIAFTIRLTPVSKKNSQQILHNPKTGKPFISQSKQYKQYERDAMWFIPKGVHVNYPVNVRCVFYMPTRRRVDKSNLEAAIHDILVKSGLLADDNRDIIAATDGSRVYYDKNNPRTEVFISPMEGYEQWGKSGNR